MKKGFGKEKSGSFAAAENIGPQVAARNLLVGDRFESGPILGVEKNLVGEPVGNELLAESRTLHDPAKAFGKGGLAATDASDRALQSGNVRFIHEHHLYTNAFVRVNKPVRVTVHKQACTVVQMPATKRKPAAKPAAPSSKRVAVPGPDGKTLGQRLVEAMAYESGRRGIEYTQKQLIDDVNGFVSADGDDKLLSQPMCSAIMLGKVSRSSFTPYLAKACHVDAVWLARGAGSKIPKP